MSMHTYPEYHEDIKEAFAGVQQRHGMEWKRAGTMLSLHHPKAEIRFGISHQMPEAYLVLPGRNPIPVQQLPVQLPSTGGGVRANAQNWLRALASYMDKALGSILSGDASALGLQPVEEEAYEQKLRKYVYDNAPIDHPARTGLFEPDWRKRAEEFLKSKGGKLS